MDPRHPTAVLHYTVPGWRPLATAVLMIACMIGVGWLARRSWVAVAVLAGLSVAWMTVDRSWEIVVLFSVAPHHGVSLADLVGVAGVVASIWLALRLRSFGARPNRRKDDRLAGTKGGDIVRGATRTR